LTRKCVAGQLIVDAMPDTSVSQVMARRAPAPKIRPIVANAAS
jgi:hypothetical protein